MNSLVAYIQPYLIKKKKKKKYIYIYIYTTLLFTGCKKIIFKDAK